MLAERRASLKKHTSIIKDALFTFKGGYLITGFAKSLWAGRI
jgi:hypothetical protein